MRPNERDLATESHLDIGPAGGSRTALVLRATERASVLPTQVTASRSASGDAAA